MSRPRAVPENEICSECGLDWDWHPENPRRRDCIELLRDQQYRRSSGLDWLSYTPDPTTSFTTYSGATTAGNIITNLFQDTSIDDDDDDPDMGVQAKVS